MFFQKKIKFILSFFILFNLLTCALKKNEKGKDDSNSSIFIDKRDGHSYPIFSLGNQKWLGADLQFETSESYCYKLKKENCEKGGRLYSQKSAQTACPKGWKLPSDLDWKILEKNLGMSDAEIEKFRQRRGSDQGEKLKTKLPFQVTFAGIGSDAGAEFQGKKVTVRYWTSSNGPSGEHFYIFRQLDRKFPTIYSDQAHFGHLHCVRCIRESMSE